MQRAIGEMILTAATLARRIAVFKNAENLTNRLRITNSSNGILLTFDDGPCEETPRVLALLAKFQVSALFFACGANVSRNPEIARDVVARGHLIGNHTYSHRVLQYCPPHLIFDELARTQDAIQHYTGVRPRWFRPPLGLRWFGLQDAQQRLGLRCMMWSHGGRDWCDPPAKVTRDCMRRLRAGSIVCLHDGRNLLARPDISTTLQVLERFLPAVLDAGLTFTTRDSV